MLQNTAIDKLLGGQRVSSPSRQNLTSDFEIKGKFTEHAHGSHLSDERRVAQPKTKGQSASAG
jgi:hypothetical protein